MTPLRPRAHTLPRRGDGRVTLRAADSESVGADSALDAGGVRQRQHAFRNVFFTSGLFASIDTRRAEWDRCPNELIRARRGWHAREREGQRGRASPQGEEANWWNGTARRRAIPSSARDCSQKAARAYCDARGKHRGGGAAVPLLPHGTEGLRPAWGANRARSAAR